jgi:hypothetical protein
MVRTDSRPGAPRRRFAPARATSEPGPFLLDPDDEARFADRWVPRNLEKSGSTPWHADDRSFEPLDAVIAEPLEELTDPTRGKTGMRTITIATDPHDGTTWSATRIRRLVAERVDRAWEIRTVWGSAEGQRDLLGELGDLVGSERDVIKAVAASGLAPKARSHWSRTAIVVLAIAVTAAAGLILKAVVGDGGALDVGGAALLGAIALMTALGQLFGKHLTVTTADEKRQAVVDALENADNPAARQRLVGRLRERLSLGGPRVVIVDDVGGVEPLTRELIFDYVRRGGERERSQLWILLEPQRRRAEVGHGGRHLASLKADHRRMWLLQYDQARLSGSERIEVLTRLDERAPRRDDPRLRRRAVRDVVAAQPDFETTAAALDATLAGAEASVLAAFAVLAAASLETAPEPIRLADLEGIAREGVSGTKATPRAAALLDLFPEGARSPQGVREALGHVAKQFTPLFDDTRPYGRGRVLVSRAYADAFVASPRLAELGEAAADRLHGFWALYWAGRLRAKPRAVIAERLSEHLRAIRRPAEVPGRQTRAIGRSLCQAAIDAVEASLAFCVSGVPALLEQANLLLVTPIQKEDRALAARVLELSWTAYALLGDRDLLGTAASVAGTAGGPELADGERRASDPLLDLYLQGLTLDPEDSLELSDEDHGPGEVVCDYARARAAWTVIVLYLREAAPLSAYVLEAMEIVADELGDVAARALERIDDSDLDDAAAALDLVIVAQAIFGMTIVNAATADDDEQHELLDSLESVQETAAELRARRQAVPRAEHFLIDGLVLELLVVGSGCAALLAQDAEHETGERGKEVARAGLRHAGLERRARTRGKVILDELEDLHILWRNLEMDALADLTAVRRNELRALSRDGRRAGARGYLTGLSASESSTLLRIESLVRETHGFAHVDQTAEQLIAAVKLAAEANLGDRITRELATVTVSATHVAAARFDSVLPYVIWPCAGSPNVLDETADDDFPRLAERLLNCVQGTDGEIQRAVREAVGARTANMAAGWPRDTVEQSLELFDLDDPQTDRRAVFARWQERMESAGEILAAVARGEDVDDDDREFAESAASRYAFVLHRLDADDVDGLAEAASAHLPSLPNDPPDRNTLLLAYTVFVLAPAGADVRLPLEVMLAGIGRYEISLRPGFNEAVYEILATHVMPEQRAEHEARRDFWAHRRSAQLVAKYLAAGAPFDAFWAAWDEHRDDLRTEPQVDDEALDVPVDARSRALEEWLDASPGREPPRPILLHGGRPHAVNGEFVRLGHFLFDALAGAPLPGSDADRQAYDAAAARSMRDLYAMLASSTPMRREVLGVLERYLERFDA